MSDRKLHPAKLKYKAKSRRRRKKTQDGFIISYPDNPLIIIIFSLVLFGIVFVFSAGAPAGTDLFNNPAYYAIRQGLFMIIGTILLIFFSKFDYKQLYKFSISLSIFTIVMIGATYIPFLGKTDYGATRWISIFGFPFQPSELAKISSILLVASALTNSKYLLSEKIIIRLGIILFMAFLILNQPNLSMFIIIMLTTAVLLLCGGVSFLLIGGVSLFGSIFIYFHILSNSYQLSRIKGWLNPWSYPQNLGYNLIQSWYAIGSGGIWGVGFGQSKQKLFWLPFRHTDFIFSVIAEELGFIGCIILIGLFIAFIHRGFLVSYRCNNIFGRLLGFGITFSIGIQAFINMSVATGVLPVTGITLPLISYGGSSVIVTMMMLGILLNISRKRVKKIDPEERCENSFRQKNNCTY